MCQFVHQGILVPKRLKSIVRNIRSETKKCRADYVRGSSWKTSALSSLIFLLIFLLKPQWKAPVPALGRLKKEPLKKNRLLLVTQITITRIHEHVQLHKIQPFLRMNLVSFIAQNYSTFYYLFLYFYNSAANKSVRFQSHKIQKKTEKIQKKWIFQGAESYFSK